MRISIFGLGYVGAVSCGCLADLGHEIIGCDVSQAKVDLINSGKPPIVEEGLEPLLQKAIKAGKLRATTDAMDAVKNSDVALLCVGTPSTRSGGVNSSYLEEVTRQVGQAVAKLNLHKHFVVMTRSTSLPHVHAALIQILEQHSGRKMGQGVGYVCHPEFLREGVAVEDFYHPPKVVFGATDPTTETFCKQMYPNIDAPTFFVKPQVAAMIKYADNCFHALKVTFGNEIGLMCKTLGVDSHAVMDVFCADLKLNISPKYLKPGFAFGGSCLPKDLRAICDKARETATPLPMLQGMLTSNKEQIAELLRRVVSENRPKVGLIGLAFKEGTDDVRESPMVTVVEGLAGKGHPIKIYDEHLSPQALVGQNRSFAFQAIPHLSELMHQNLQEVVNWADVLIVAHRLKPQTWANVNFKSGQRVIDLINVPAVKSAPGYDGLYW
jgi:GDP-mannose 6-dehydrogenase